MATYFHGNSEIQSGGGADGSLQTLVLMNPGYIHYSDTPQQQQPPSHGGATGNFVFLNAAAAANGNNNSFNPHAPPTSHTQQLVGIPLGAATSQDHNHHHHHQHSMHAHHDVPSLHGFLPRMQYNNNPWNTIDQNTAARDTPRAQQGLSLSLSSQQARFGQGQGQAPAMSGGSPSSASGITASAATNINFGGSGGIQSVLLSSKYLKAAHELLEEVVSVNTELLAKKGGGGQNKVINGVGESSAAAAGSGGDGSIGGGGGEGNGKRSSDLSTAERQEIQMKKAKLISMLDEVEQRYRQYHHQMEIVVSSFEQAAGIGSARTYTALALQTISKQFRCLKDAIAGQIRAANKSLGEEDCFGGGKIEGSRLKYVDNHLRQQRALQQLGMIQHNAWRPQRGLPERSVSVLRAWLFEHFLHPYPKDSDKHMLAKQTGLTRSQVSNWFINARVRLWKPMVEEMYMEEMKENEQNGSEDKSSKSNEDSSVKMSATQEKGPTSETKPKGFHSPQENVSKSQNTPIVSVSRPPPPTSPLGGNVRNQSGFSFIGSSELEGIAQGSPKKPRNHEIMHSPNSVPSINMDVKPNEANNEQLSMKFGDERQSRDGYSFMGNQTNFMGGFGQYPIGDIGRFDAEQFTPRFSSNGVSLTLGLDSIPGTHQTFLPNQNIQLGRSLDIGEPNEFGAINTSSPHSTAAYESISMQNPKRFAAQLLPDFVA